MNLPDVAPHAAPDAADAAGAVPPARPIGSFIDYKRVVLDLSNDLHTLEKHATALGLTGAADEIRAVLARLLAEKFNIVVVGEFNRGKSSLINALLGVSVAPTDVLACTAVLTRLTYALDKRAVIEFKDGTTQQIAYDALPDYITKLTDESEQLAQTIERATIHYPSPYCQNNVDVIDTPGLNEAQAMTDVTLSVLPAADAAIMVIMAHAPFSDYERDFLETRLLSADLGRVIFVVNGIDRLNSPQDVARVLAGVGQRITEHVLERAQRQFGAESAEYDLYRRKIGTPTVFGLSAREALQAKRSNDLERFERSRFGAFEAHLQNFLTEQRGALMLQPPLNRCLSASRALLQALELRQAALALSESAFDRAMAEATAKIEAARQQWEIEQRALDAAGVTVRRQASELGGLFIQRLKEAIDAEIAAMPIATEEFSGNARKKADKEVTRLVSRATARTADEFSERLKTIVETALSRQADRLKDFDGRISTLMSAVSQYFTEFETPEGTGRAMENTMLTVSVLTGFGGIWSGYRSAGIKGAAVGLGASAGTAFASGLVLSAIGVSVGPILVPVAIAAGVLSIFTGRWAADAVFRASRIEHYKAHATRAAHREIDRGMSAASVGSHFGEAAGRSFDVFKDAIRTHATAVLSDTTAQLEQARQDCARERSASEHQRASWGGMRDEVRAVADRSIALSARLAGGHVANGGAAPQSP